MKGIDVSHWNYPVNFKKVKDDGIEFVILKAGGSDKGFYRDSKFIKYYNEAKEAGLHIGCYYFVGPKFNSSQSGLSDAIRFLSLIKGLSFDMPIYLDLEAPPPTTKSGNTDAAIAFCDYLEHKGYYVGIYASDSSGFKERLDYSRLTMYDTWVARYGKNPEYIKKFGMWQYSSSGSVQGINGKVDMNLTNKDYPLIIKKAKLNHC